MYTPAINLVNSYKQSVNTVSKAFFFFFSVCPVIDDEDEAWCNTNFLNASALRLAVAIRAELLEVMQRIELPVSPPAFGCQDNTTNIKRALVSGFFLKVARIKRYCEHIISVR